MLIDETVPLVGRTKNCLLNQKGFKCKSHILHNTFTTHFSFGFSDPQSIEHQWKPRSRTSSNGGMQIKTSPESWSPHVGFGDSATARRPTHFRRQKAKSRIRAQSTSKIAKLVPKIGYRLHYIDERPDSLECRMNHGKDVGDIMGGDTHKTCGTHQSNTQRSFTGDRWTQLTQLVKIMTRTTFTQSNLSVSSVVVNPFFFQHEQTCRRIFFAASASVKQKPVHGTAMIARKTNDKNADMDYHAVPPPDYGAGRDSKREELCHRDPQTFTITATGGQSSSGRLEAIGAASRSGRPEAVKDP